MAINRPSKPSATLPNDFGGVQTPYTSAQISSGYQDGVPQVVDGGNMNYERKGLFQGMKYLRTVVDFIRDTPIGKIFWVNSSGQMDYMTPAVIATDSEYNTGTATDRVPNVKQVVDNLALKADDNSVVHKSGNETITGQKTFLVGYNGVIIKNQQANSYSDLSFMDNSGNLIAKIRGGINNNQKYILIGQGADMVTTATPTEDTETSNQIDTVGARNTKLKSYTTTTYVNNKFQVVSTLPANPDKNTFYFVTGA